MVVVSTELLPPYLLQSLRTGATLCHQTVIRYEQTNVRKGENAEFWSAEATQELLFKNYGNTDLAIATLGVPSIF